MSKSSVNKCKSNKNKMECQIYKIKTNPFFLSSFPPFPFINSNVMHIFEIHVYKRIPPPRSHVTDEMIFRTIKKAFAFSFIITI